MRKSILCLAFAALLSALPAAAQEIIVPGEVTISEPVTRSGEITETPGSPSHWYVGGEFGAMIVEDMDVDVGAVENAITINHEYGYDGGIFVGYDFGAFRVEAEAAYKKADLDFYNTTIRLPLEGALFPAQRDAGGSSSALSFMINGMLDFGDEDGISGFVGGGVGMARVKANNYRNFANATPFLDGSDTKLAWQVFAGVRQRVSDNIDVTVKYRFFNADKVELLAFNGAESELRFRSHSLLGGITFRFGGGGPVRICASTGEPISAAKPCTVTVCENGSQLDPVTGKCRIVGRDMKRCEPGGELVELSFVCPNPCPEDIHNPNNECGPYMLFFGWDREQLGEKSEKDTAGDRELIDKTLVSQLPVLERALEFARKTKGQVELLVVGHADKSGPDVYNDGLSCRRAETVYNWFVERNVRPILIGTDWRGEHDPLRPTEDGVREVENRRVVITFGSKDGGRPLSCPPRRKRR